MSDFFQILQREEETKKAPNKSPILSIKEDKPLQKPVEKPKPLKSPKLNKEKKETAAEETLLTKSIMNPVWLNIAEAAKIGGVQPKTIRRAIKLPNSPIKFKIRLNRYLIDLRSLILYLYSNRKLKNKLNQNGIGQYIKTWKG